MNARRLVYIFKHPIYNFAHIYNGLLYIHYLKVKKSFNAKNKEEIRGQRTSLRNKLG